MECINKEKNKKKDKDASDSRSESELGDKGKDKKGPVKRALLIGINYVGTNAELNGCWNDANDMYSYLLSHGYKPRDMIKMTDERHNKKTSLLPTRDNILNNLKSMVDLTETDDTLFLHISGHGGEVRDNNGDEVDGKDSVVYACDDKTILDDELRKLTIDSMALGSKLRVVIDACHSGTAMDCRYRLRSGGRFIRENKSQKRSVNVVMISGCTDDSTSADAYMARRYNGALTRTMLNILKIHNDLTWEELLNVLRYELKRGGFTQVPQLNVEEKLAVKEKFNI